MSLLRRNSSIRTLYHRIQLQQSSPLLGSSRSYSGSDSNDGDIHNSRISCLKNAQNTFPWTDRRAMALCSKVTDNSLAFWNHKRLASTQVNAPPQQAQRKGAFQLSMVSPGIVVDPYTPREAIPLWRRLLTRSGWRRTKEDITLELRSAYAISKLRKSGYNKQKFYVEAVELYKEINTLMANGDKTTLRKSVTEKMYSILKNEIKLRESQWSKVHWELVEPIIKIRTLRARMIGVDQKDINKTFIQLTLEFLSKQKFEAYDSKGAVVAGDKTKEILVRDIWVFEKSMFHPGAFWRLCGRIKV